jgi:hypothetical protein
MAAPLVRFWCPFRSLLQSIIVSRFLFALDFGTFSFVTDTQSRSVVYTVLPRSICIHVSTGHLRPLHAQIYTSRNQSNKQFHNSSPAPPLAHMAPLPSNPQTSSTSRESCIFRMASFHARLPKQPLPMTRPHPQNPMPSLPFHLRCMAAHPEPRSSGCENTGPLACSTCGNDGGDVCGN